MFKVENNNGEQIRIMFNNGYIAIYPYRFFPCKQKQISLLCKIIDISDDPDNAIYYLSDFLTELLDNLDGNKKVQLGKNINYIFKRYNKLFEDLKI